MTEIISNLDVTKLVIDHPIGEDNPPLLFPHSDDPSQKPLTQHVLQQSDFDISWQDKLTDTQLDTFVDNGWIIIDEVFETKALLALQAESGFIDYRDAELTAGIRVSDIRGDRIRWITENFFAGFIICKLSMRLLAYLIAVYLPVFATVRRIMLAIRWGLATNGIVTIQLGVMNALSLRCFISMMNGNQLTAAH